MKNKDKEEVAATICSNSEVLVVATIQNRIEWEKADQRGPTAEGEGGVVCR